MSGQVSRDVGRWEWEKALVTEGLGVKHLAVALAMATYGDADGTCVRPGIKRLARIGVSERTVIRAVAALNDAGYIRKVGNANRWTNHAAEYRLTLPTEVTAQTPASPDVEVTRLSPGGPVELPEQPVEVTQEASRSDPSVTPPDQNTRPSPPLEQNAAAGGRRGEVPVLKPLPRFADPWADPSSEVWAEVEAAIEQDRRLAHATALLAELD